MKKKIFVVENDEDILNVVTAILEDHGYVVVSSRTEQGVVERLIEEKPDAVILDIIKPTLQGTALCDAIKKTESIKGLPIIVLSTYPNIKSYNVDCADSIISKPFDISEVVRTVESYLLV